MNGLLTATAVASLVPTGMALDHWAVQLQAFARAVWRLFVLWVQAVTSGLPLVGPLLAAHPGVDHLPDNWKHNRALRREFQKAKKEAEAEAERLLAEAAAEQVPETPADDPDGTQPFKPYLVKGVA